MAEVTFLKKRNLRAEINIKKFPYNDQFYQEETRENKRLHRKSLHNKHQNSSQVKVLPQMFFRSLKKFLVV